MDTFNNHLHLPVTKVDFAAPMLERLAGVSDPEAKRKAIGAAFIDVFKAYATKLEAELGTKPKFLVQVGGRRRAGCCGCHIPHAARLCAAAPRCAVLCCAVLYCAVLCCAVLRCAVWPRTWDGCWGQAPGVESGPGWPAARACSTGPP
jgi:hypothetical protein